MENPAQASAPVHDQGTGKTLWGIVARYFLEGLFILLPLTITGAVIIWLAGVFTRQFGQHSFVGGYLKIIGISLAGDSPAAYFLGWLAVIGMIFILGFIVDIGAKTYVQRSIDMIMKRIPVVNRLYKVSVRIVDMLNKNERKEFKGMRVVYCTFGGGKGALFLALMPTPRVYAIDGVEYNVVLIPSAPIPVGGSLMLVPVTSVRPAGISVDEFTQLYLSMGASSDDILPGNIQLNG